MRRKDEASRLRAITEIRDVQRAAAEIEAARAAKALREKNEARDEAERRRQSAEECWFSAIQAPAVSLDVVPLWAARLLHETEGSRRASADMEAANAELKRRAADWHAAIGRRDTANMLAGKAKKEEVRRRDEASLQESADRHSRRRGTL